MTDYPETKDTWWALARAHRESLEALSLRWSRHHAAFDKAYEESNALSLHKVLSSAWIVSPGSRSVYSVPGFNVLCHLLETFEDCFMDELEEEYARRAAETREHDLRVVPDDDRQRYASWIRENVKGEGTGECEEATAAMVAAFPELEQRKGFYYSVSWGRRTHWWCRTSDGLIVDPTARQYPCGVLFPQRSASFYEDLTNLDEEELLERVPTGSCMECGGEAYKYATFCSEACEAQAIAEHQ